MTQNMQATLCFIGAGNMATSLIGGLIANQYPAQNIIANDIDSLKLDALQQQFSIRTENQLHAAVANADIVILSVKPQVLQQVCRALALAMPANKPKTLFISIAAGVRATDINRWLGGDLAVVRCMPNTPALVGLGASALFANDAVSDLQKQQAEQIMQSTGVTVWVNPESQLDAVTAISGSGPAYFFLFIEALQNAAIELGLNPQTAALLARQTALGAATMALGQDVARLRQQVTSKGGTTAQAIASFESANLSGIVLEATRAAEKRSQELANQLASDTQ
ncbi:MAG: pyrroline-5-carboxylate reductase [Gammaproteobacteria bacterium]|nr:pyrroline-5-carboxylate reductase [Gammaproteobacteria bacterium]